MAVIAQCNQIIVFVAARMTTELLVVHLKIRHRAATSGIANRLAVVHADGRLRKTREGVAAEDSWVEFGSRRLLQGMSHECLLLFSRQKF